MSVPFFLISQPKHMLWAPKTMVKKLLTVLRSNIYLFKTYEYGMLFGRVYSGLLYIVRTDIILHIRAVR